jgi:hypothetical protein
MIQHDNMKVTGYPLDNTNYFGEMLMDLETREPGKAKCLEIRRGRSIANSSDAPTLAGKAKTRVHDEYRVNRCKVFRGRGADALHLRQ